MTRFRASQCWLIILGFHGCATPSPPRDIAIPSGQVLWAGEDPDFVTGSISPDGRYLSDINWASGDLQLIDLQTGGSSDLTGRGYDAGGYAWMSAFSPAGDRIAVAWYRPEADSHELRVSGVDGLDSRVLIPAGNGHYYVDPVDWAPTGLEILVAIRNPGRIWQLALVSVADGSTRIIKTLRWQTPGGGHDQAYPDAKISPDGQFVAYDYPADDRLATRDIFLVRLSGESTNAVVQGAGSDRTLGWLPDGGGILFYSDRNGLPSVWRQPVHQGVAAGSPELVAANVPGLIPLGFTPRGYAFGVNVETERIHTAAIDSTGKAGSATPVIDPVWRRSYAADWSPDGTRLAYITHDPFPDPVESLVIVGPSGMVERKLILTPGLHTSNGTLRWVSDNRILLFAYQEGREGIHAVDLITGATARLETPEGIGRAAIKWFEAGPGGRMLYLVGDRSPDRGVNPILALDLISGEVRMLGAAEAIPNSLAVSPDGTELAFLARDDVGQLALGVMATDGRGTFRRVYRAPTGRLAAPVAWSPAGARLIFELEHQGTPSLWSISREGGAPSLFLPACCRENDIRINRSGGRVAFAAGAERGEVRVIPLGGPGRGTR